MLENPRNKKLVILALSLYINIGEGSRAETLIGRRWNISVPFVKVSASYYLYFKRYDISTSGLKPPLEYNHK